MKSRSRNRKKGNTFAEIGPALWILIVGVFLPLFDMCSIGIRTGLVANATTMATAAAARSDTFLIAASPSLPSATQQATSTFQQLTSGLSGISSTSVTTAIVITNIATKVVTTQTTPLAQAANTSLYVYAIRVKTVSKIQPLVNLNSTIFGSVPGVTAPITFTSSATQYFEDSQGLNQ